MKILNLIMCTLAWLLCSTAFAEAPRDIKIGGGGASCKQIFASIQDNYEIETGVHLVINPTTPVQGLIELNNGYEDIVVSPIPFSSMVKGAARNGVIIDPGLFSVRNVGAANILVFVHKTNNVASLSKKQLQDIFTGKIRNWRQVGGENLPIVVVWGVSTPGQNELFTKQVMDGRPVTESAVEAFDYYEIREKISRTPGAIGIDPQGFSSANTRNPKTPAVRSEIIAVTKGQGKPQVERLLKYVKDYNW